MIETKTLNEIRTNLQLDLAELNADIAIMDSISLAGEVVINYITRHNEPSGSFKYDV